MAKIVYYKDSSGYEQYKISIPRKIIIGLKLDIKKSYEWIIGKNGVLTLVEMKQ